MQDSKVIFTWNVVAACFLISGCAEDLGYFLDFGSLRISCYKGKVNGISGDSLYSKSLPHIRLAGSPGCVVALQGIKEEELAKIATSVEPSGDRNTFYKFEGYGHVRFSDGKFHSFSFRGPGVSIATSKDGPFLNLPADEREIRKLFGKPSRIVKYRRPFT